MTRRVPRHRWGIARESLAAVLTAVVLALFARSFAVRAVVIPSASMADTLQVGDHVLVNTMLFRPTLPGWLAGALPQRPVRRGDVVVLRSPLDPRRLLVKRCVGLPGEEIRLTDGRLLVDGRSVEAPPGARPDTLRSLPAGTAGGAGFEPVVVPPGRYFFLGDNREASEDSRSWGTVAADQLVGRAWLIYWSREPGGAAAGSALGIRWRRCLRLVR